MKILSVIFGVLLAITCSLAALFRYWLIMTFGVGFAAVGDSRLNVDANASLVTGIIGLLLSLATIVCSSLLFRRKFLAPRRHSMSAVGLRTI
jgi:hypothetical protein